MESKRHVTEALECVMLLCQRAPGAVRAVASSAHIEGVLLADDFEPTFDGKDWKAMILAFVVDQVGRDRDHPRALELLEAGILVQIGLQMAHDVSFVLAPLYVTGVVRMVDLFGTNDDGYLSRAMTRHLTVHGDQDVQSQKVTRMPVIGARDPNSPAIFGLIRSIELHDGKYAVRAIRERVADLTRAADTSGDDAEDFAAVAAQWKAAWVLAKNFRWVVNVLVTNPNHEN